MFLRNGRDDIVLQQTRGGLCTLARRAEGRGIEERALLFLLGSHDAAQFDVGCGAKGEVGSDRDFMQGTEREQLRLHEVGMVLDLQDGGPNSCTAEEVHEQGA